MRTIWLGTIVLGLMFLYACASSDTKTEPRPRAAMTPAPRTSADSNMEILMQKVKADKKLLVASNMDLTDTEAREFWPVYDAYQNDLEQINRRLLKTIMDYAEASKNGSVPNDMAEKLLNEALAVEEAEVNLKRSSAQKLGKVLPDAKVARYIQIENKIRAVVRAGLAQEIPLIY